MGQSTSAADAQVARASACMLGLGGAHVANGATSNSTKGDETSGETRRCRLNSGKGGSAFYESELVMLFVLTGQYVTKTCIQCNIDHETRVLSKS